MRNTCKESISMSYVYQADSSTFNKSSPNYLDGQKEKGAGEDRADKTPKYEQQKYRRSKE